MPRKEKILILTPVKDAEAFLDTYFKSMAALTYPHNLISLGFLESDSADGTFSELEKRLPDLKMKYRKAGLWKKDFGYRIPHGEQRWLGEIQAQRRSVLAKSRNHLLFRALDDEDWVLWLDVDVVEYPEDIIQSLLETDKDIVQPNCVMEYGGNCFDLNAWRDKGKNHLHDLRAEGDLVPIHAVGGTMLLVRADVHREGLIFPAYFYGTRNQRIRRVNFFLVSKKKLLNDGFGVLSKLFRGGYQGEVETEGLGMMAHDMGYECWGMPNLEIRHQ